jgi:DNA-binding beta-propeller fold protein YncE
MKTSKKNLLLSIMLVIIIALTVSNVWTYTNLQNSNTNTSQVIQPNQSTIELQSTQTPSPFPNTTSVQSVWQLPLPPDNSQPGHFNGPIDIAVDMGGNVYVADSGNSRIQIFNSNGKFITQWLSFYDLRAIAIANNNLFTLQNNVIKKFSLNGTLLTSWTAPSPIDLAVDSNGTVYVLDSADYCVQKYTDNGTFKNISEAMGKVLGNS